MMELSKVYTPEETERRWYSIWEERGYFKPFSGPESLLRPFAIVIPPPNVTGSLHMGHALNATLQDVLIRWRRMQGHPTVWVPGTDHGGIATQNVVEKMLRNEKKTRQDLGRQAFLKRMWQWREESGDTILMQLKRLGASCDWTRTRFTMDEVCSKAVRTAFVKLFEKGLIYRGPRMVNWCPRCRTALADIEVEHEDRSGKLWYIRYPLSSGQGTVVVATTRPETMLGDTAVAVNPDDTRFHALIGQKIRLPLTQREIPIVADAAVDASFGTGAVKVTPAHDQTDFDIAERQKLPHRVVINFDGKMTSEAGAAYAGLDRFEARKKIIEDLETQGFLDKTENYRLSAATCYRCQTIVEPLVSEQWFMRMNDLATRAAEATREGRVKIHPSSWEKPYIQWLENIRDWCISRQIWWGHQIPVYYCASGRCPAFASVEPPTQCPHCKGTSLKQDEDVLDTWFSSALWPFSVFGWPDDSSDLKTFYPTSVLVTGHEILYLWVARMVMLGLEFQKDVPFRHVYIHGIVRDKQGKKMSKSLGNVIDPLDIMKQYGTDALRLSLAESSIPGRDMQLSNDSFLKARNFANKLWNVSRFVLMNMGDYSPATLPPSSDLTLVDRWILHSLQQTVTHVTEALESYNPAEASRALYDFVWSSFCDWYIEISKIHLIGSDPTTKHRTQTVLIHVLDSILRLLHPTMPYETEAVYEVLRPYVVDPKEFLMIQRWPTPDLARLDRPADATTRQLQNVITAIRTVRSEMNVPPGKPIDCWLKTRDPQWVGLLQSPEWEMPLRTLARIQTLKVTGEFERPPESAVTVFDGGEIYIPLKGLIDMAKEKARLQKNLQQLLDAAARDRSTFENIDFRSRAPHEEVERLKTRLQQAQTKAALLQRNLEGL